MNTYPEAVLFDLDGTLVDTAPDLLHALNLLRNDHHLSPLTLAELRPIVSLSSRGMIKKALDIDENDPRFETLRQNFFSLYEIHLADRTVLFPGIETILAQCEAKKLPWGIVTNKLTRHTQPLLSKLKLAYSPHCVVCGDTLSTSKPHPEPIRYACSLLNKKPEQCWYVGDSLVDMQASHAAGTRSILALYGYINADTDISTWQADICIKTPDELLTLL